MLKKLLYFIITITTIEASSLVAAPSRNEANGISIACSPELRSCLDKILQLPEARELISKIQKEGAIQVYVNPDKSQKFGALWDVQNRIILVNVSSNRPEGSLIASILFELHNASINSKLNKLDYQASIGSMGQSDLRRNC